MDIKTIYKIKEKCSDSVAKSLILEAKSKTIREHVDSYTDPVCESMGFRNMRTGEIIKKATNLYMTKSNCESFYKKCDELNKENGYTVKEGYCPALVAETDYRNVNKEIVETACKIIDIIVPIKLEQYNELLDIVKGICLTKEA